MTLLQPSHCLRKLFIGQDINFRNIYDLSLIEYNYILCVTVANRLFCSDLYQRNIKGTYYWSFVKRVPPVTGGCPSERANDAESVYMVRSLYVM